MFGELSRGRGAAGVSSCSNLLHTLHRNPYNTLDIGDRERFQDLSWYRHIVLRLCSLQLLLSFLQSLGAKTFYLGCDASLFIFLEFFRKGSRWFTAYNNASRVDEVSI